MCLILKSFGNYRLTEGISQYIDGLPVDACLSICLNTKQVKTNRILIISALSLLILIVGLTLWFNRSEPTPQEMTSTASNSSKLPDTQLPLSNRSQELVIGNPAAKATITEYIDFKCPSCNKFYHEAAQDIKKDYIDKELAKLVIRNVPYIAPDSTTAALASYCAADQAKFSAYHDGLFNYIWNNYYSKGDYSAERKEVFNREVLIELARVVGMDEATFTSCLNSKKHQASIDEDIKEVEALEVRGTPFFLIGGQGIVGPQPYKVFKTLIDIELNK